MNRKLLRITALLTVFVLMAAGALGLHSALRTTRLPVLMYHHFDEASEMDTVVSAARFREQMAALVEAGFTAVTMEQAIDYVAKGTPLPKRPVLITMDDGYTSNLTIAAPILEELGLQATVFVIGINEGEEFYPHSGEPLYIDRFSYEEATPWVEKGVIDLQYHSFDMHQLSDYGFSGRDGMLPLPGESAEDYAAAIRADLDAFQKRREDHFDTPLTALAYPFGFYTKELDGLLAEEGITLTFTVEERCSRLVQGDADSLRMLGRFNVTDRMTGPELVRRLIR